MMIANVHGQFDVVDGVVHLDPDQPDRTNVEVRIEAASINTRESKRDEHLRSADFLDAEKYPYLTFKSKRVEVVDGNRAKLIGDLTIRDVTREVTLDVEHTGMQKSPWGQTVAGFSARTKINRKDWKLTWNVALETGGWLVDDYISIDIELEVIKVEAAESMAV